MILVRAFFLALVALAIFSLASSAAVVELNRHGAWAVHGGTTTTGRRTCGVVATLPGDRLFVIQYLAGDDALLVRASRRSWSIPRDVRVEVRTEIGALSWRAIAEPRTDEVRWLITADTMREWERAFRAGSVMRLEFPAGSEQPWIISLTGSNRAIITLGACIRALGDMGGARPPAWPTQPHSPPSQPHEAPRASGVERRT